MGQENAYYHKVTKEKGFHITQHVFLQLKKEVLLIRYESSTMLFSLRSTAPLHPTLYPHLEMSDFLHIS